MKLTPPFGYDEIVPLQKTHRVRMGEGVVPPALRRANAIALCAAEIVPASRDYPVVFVSLDGAKTFAPVAVLGLDAAENLFVDAQGGWDASSYVPAFVRRYPFCVSKLYVDGVPRGERVVCVARAALDAAGTALFDGQGAAAPAWQAAERLLNAYEAELDRTASLCAALAGNGLLEPFTVRHVGGAAPEVSLRGMHRVSQEKLVALAPAAHREFAADGSASVVYAHLHSLANFSRLAARRAARRSGRGTG